MCSREKVSHLPSGSFRCALSMSLGPSLLRSRGMSRTEDSRESDALSVKESKGTLLFLAVVSH